jgi:hypothetical protein
VCPQQVFFGYLVPYAITFRGSAGSGAGGLGQTRGGTQGPRLPVMAARSIRCWMVRAVIEGSGRLGGFWVRGDGWRRQAGGRSFGGNLGAWAVVE